jgi:hypothetical protein
MDHRQPVARRQLIDQLSLATDHYSLTAPVIAET